MHVLSEESGAGEQRQQVDFLCKARKDKRFMFPQKSKWLKQEFGAENIPQSQLWR